MIRCSLPILSRQKSSPWATTGSTRAATHAAHGKTRGSSAARAGGGGGGAATGGRRAAGNRGAGRACGQAAHVCEAVEVMQRGRCRREAQGAGRA